MKTIATMFVISVLIAGCGGGGDTYNTRAYDDPYDTRGALPDPGQSVEVSAHTEGGLEFRTHELGTDRTRGRAKTVEWMKLSTVTGTKYLSGRIIVDRVIRNDAQDNYSVELRLKNTSPTPIAIEYRVYFLDEEANRVLGRQSLGFATETKEDWNEVALDGYGFQSISDGARMRGAVGFDLRIRGAGGSGEGKPDAGR